MKLHLGIFHLMIWNESKIPGGDHDAGEVLHDRGCLNMNIVQHGITAPVPNNFDPVVINAGAQECH